MIDEEEILIQVLIQVQALQVQALTLVDSVVDQALVVDHQMDGRK
jgi:hypothetical protein